MSYTASDLTEVQKAIKSGARKVRIGGKEVEYRSLDELRAIESLITRHLAGNKKRLNKTTFRS